MTKVDPIPQGFSTVTPNLVVDDGAAAIDFYERAFGAEVLARLEAGGMLMHATLRIGDAVITLSDAMPPHGLEAPAPGAGVSVFLTLYVEDADAWHRRALDAGAEEINPVSAHVHGDRAGSLRDPFGHRWAMATHVEDVSADEIERRLAGSA